MGHTVWRFGFVREFATWTTGAKKVTLYGPEGDVRQTAETAPDRDSARRAVAENWGEIDSEFSHDWDYPKEIEVTPDN